MSNELQIDVGTQEEARCLHRVVRAMHDGHCPNCGHLDDAELFKTDTDYRCPACVFGFPAWLADMAIREFNETMRKNVDVFNAWRERKGC